MSLPKDRPDGLVPIGHVDAMGPCRYREVARSGRLPRPVAAVWRSEVRHSGVLHVVPDCCVELVRASDGAVQVWGPSVGARYVPLEGGASYVGVRLRVGSASAVLRLPVHRLAGHVVSAADAGPAGALRSESDSAWVAGVLALAAERTGDWLQDPVASLAPALLGRPASAVASVAAALGLGERQLRRRFGDVVGVSPSAFRRLARTRHALRDLVADRSGPTIADIAHAHGFTDQSHLTREVVALTGMTPGTLRQSSSATGTRASTIPRRCQV